MLLDAMRHGVMDGHLSKWHVRVVDACDPASAFPDNGGLGPFHAVILNYLLDCLPASVLRAEEGQLKQRCVRTCLARNARLSDDTERTPKELAELAKSREPRAREELDRLADLFTAEYAFMPVDRGNLPYLDDSAPVPDGTTRVHSHGAIDALEKLVPMLSDGGFILINDYGSTEAEAGSDFEHQRYSGATFVGVHFGLLKRHFEGRPSGQFRLRVLCREDRSGCHWTTSPSGEFPAEFSRATLPSSPGPRAWQATRNERAVDVGFHDVNHPEAGEVSFLVRHQFPVAALVWTRY